MLSLFLVLLCASFGALASASDPYTADLDAEPLRESFLLFDVNTLAHTDDVKLAFASVNPIYQFKVIGESRYLILVKNDESEALKLLCAPVGSSVAQYPVEHYKDFYAMFGAMEDVEYPTLSPLPDKDLFFGQIHIKVDGMTNDEYKELMKTHGDDMAPLLKIKERALHSFANMGRLSPRFFHFGNFEAAQVSRIPLDAAEDLGGPGNIEVTLFRIVNI